MECVPNFSEGRDLQKIDKIVAPFRGKQGVKLLDYSNDEDHNRLVGIRNFELLQISRERSKKTEGVFLGVSENS